LTIECQNGVINPDFSGDEGLPGECARRDIVSHIARLSARCRELSIPVFHSTLAHRPDWAGSNVNSALLRRNQKLHKMIAGTDETLLHPGLGATSDDFVLERMHGVTAFYNSALDQLLRNCDVRTIIVAGVSTNLGIPAAAIEAVNRGYTVIVPEDCTAGVWPEAHQFVIEQFLPPLAVVTSSEAILEHLAAAHAA